MFAVKVRRPIDFGLEGARHKDASLDAALVEGLEGGGASQGRVGAWGSVGWPGCGDTYGKSPRQCGVKGRDLRTMGQGRALRLERLGTAAGVGGREV